MFVLVLNSSKFIYSISCFLSQEFAIAGMIVSLTENDLVVVNQLTIFLNTAGSEFCFKPTVSAACLISAGILKINCDR